MGDVDSIRTNASRMTRRTYLLNRPVVPQVPPPDSVRPTTDEFATMAFEKHFLSGKFSARGGRAYSGASNTGEPSIGPIPASALHPDMDPMLRSVVMALGLISAPSIRRDRSIQQLALQKHWHALTLTNKALSDPLTAVRDSTLMTVILLQLYEALTWSDASSLKNWTAHVDGAATLLKLRGAEQFKSPIGLAMFTYIKQRTISGCLRQSKAVPVHLIRLGRISRRYQTADELQATNLTEIVTEYCHFRHELRQKQLVEPDAIVKRLIQLDCKLLNWERNLPNSYRWQRVHVPNTTVILEGKFDVYTRRWAAAVWNKYRDLRIFINQKLRSYLALASSAGTRDTADRVSALQRTIRTLSSDLCASVPFIMMPQSSWSDPCDTESNNSPSLHTKKPGEMDSDRPTPVEQVDVNAIAWVLYPIAEDRYNPPEMRQWVLDVLRRLAADGGSSLSREWTLIARQSVWAHTGNSFQYSPHDQPPSPKAGVSQLIKGSVSVLNEGVPYGLNEGVCWGNHPAGIYDTYSIPADLGKGAIPTSTPLGPPEPKGKPRKPAGTNPSWSHVDHLKQYLQETSNSSKVIGSLPDPFLSQDLDEQMLAWDEPAGRIISSEMCAPVQSTTPERVRSNNDTETETPPAIEPSSGANCLDFGTGTRSQEHLLFPDRSHSCTASSLHADAPPVIGAGSRDEYSDLSLWGQSQDQLPFPDSSYSCTIMSAPEPRDTAGGFCLEISLGGRSEATLQPVAEDYSS